MTTEGLPTSEDDPYKKFAQKESRNVPGGIMPENYRKGFANVPILVEELAMEDDSEKRKEIMEKIDHHFKQLFADMDQGLTKIEEMKSSGDSKSMELSRMFIEKEREELERLRNLVNELL